MPVLFDVQRNSDVLVQLLTDDALDDELQRLQRVASAPDQQPGVGATDVDYRAAGKFIVFRPEIHVHFGAYVLQDALDRLDRRACGSVRRNQLDGSRSRGCLRYVSVVVDYVIVIVCLDRGLCYVATSQ